MPRKRAPKAKTRYEMVQEIDGWVAYLDDANLRGFMVRVPESKFYRSPPRGTRNDEPTDKQIRELVVECELRVKAHLNKLQADRRRLLEGAVTLAEQAMSEGRATIPEDTLNTLAKVFNLDVKDIRDQVFAEAGNRLKSR